MTGSGSSDTIVSSTTGVGSDGTVATFTVDSSFGGVYSLSSVVYFTSAIENGGSEMDLMSSSDPLNG